MKYPATLLCIALACSVSATSNADTPQPRVVLGPHAKDLKVGPGMDARGVRMEGCQFAGQDLRGARFDGCDLFDVLFHDCDLTNASFRRAHMTGMIIRGSIVDGLDVTDATINGIRHFRLGFQLGAGHTRHGLELNKSQLISTRSFKNKNLDWCAIDDASGLDLSGFSICHSTIEHDLSETVFSNTRLSHTFISGTKLDFKQLVTIDNFRLGLMIDVSLGGRLAGRVDFSKMNLTGSGFSRLRTPEGRPIPSLNFFDAIIRDCVFGNDPGTTYIPFEKVQQTASFKMKDLRGLGLFYFDLDETDLSGFDLSGTRFGSCDLTNVSLADTIITDMSFSDCTGLTTEQIRSTWNYKNDRMDGIDLPPEIEAELKAETE